MAWVAVKLRAYPAVEKMSACWFPLRSVSDGRAEREMRAVNIPGQSVRILSGKAGNFDTVNALVLV